MTRRTLRRRLLLLGLLPLLLALAFAAKVGSMLVLDRDGRASYDASQWGAARGSFAANATLNVLEPWVAPFGEGTARYREEDFGGAVSALEAALLDVPPEQECLVRINLALAHEAVGDTARADQDPAAARVAYRAGVVALADCLGLPERDRTAPESESEQPETPPEEQPEPQPESQVDPTAEVGGARVTDARAVDARLREKLREAREAERPDQASDDPAEAQQQEQLDERNQQGEDQRDKTEQRQQDEQDQQQSEPPPTEEPSGDSTDPPPPVYEW